MDDLPDTLPEQTIVGSGASPWVEVECEGVIWLVWPEYVPCVGIGEAAEMAKAEGCELPTPALVDAIWRKADLIVTPLPRAHNGTWQQMSAPEVYQDQRHRLQLQLQATGHIDGYTLIAGQFKDVVRHNGKLGIYGWHVASMEKSWKGIPLHTPETPGLGRVIQPASTIHSPTHGDYSQGYRRCMRKAA